MFLQKNKNFMKIDNILISDSINLKNILTRKNISFDYSKSFHQGITYNKNNNYSNIKTSNDFIFKKTNFSNNIFNYNKKYFSLGYRAEDLDAKPMKKNKYDNVKLSFGREARDNILKGIKTISENVAITYGPLGKNVVIDDNDNPIVTKDGVTVAKHISLTKRKHNLGCRLLSIIAGNTNEFAGDGTTTATVLAGELSK